MPKSREAIAEDTREIRLQMVKLVEAGLSEQEALRNCTPRDSNRTKKFALWKRLGLWPVPTEELPSERSGHSGSTQKLMFMEASRRGVRRRLQPQQKGTSGKSKEELPTGDSDQRAAQEKDMADVTSEQESVDPNLLLQLDPARKLQEAIGIEFIQDMCESIELSEREWYGKASGKAPEAKRFVQIGAKVPPDVAHEFRQLPGRMAHNLERALRLYLKVQKKIPKEE